MRRLGELCRGHRIGAKVLAVLTVALLVGAAYFAWFRPYQLTWGATRAEVEQPMPGDALNPEPSFRATRAITIVGSPDEVWPWLLQMGYGRAGYYGYDLLENLGSPAGICSADEILPEFQHFDEGDEVPISAVVSMTFYEVEPKRHLIWVGSEDTNPGAFTWALYPLEGSQTRLVSRIRWSYHWASLSAIPLEVFTEFSDHIAVRKILQGVKGRVEGYIEPMWLQNLELFVFFVTFFTFATSLLLIFLRRLTWHSWGTGVIAGAIWLTTWYTPIPTPVSALLALATIGVLCAPFRNRRELA